jgi:hypothetical protein
MDFTFGIITAGENDAYINEMIDSIIKNNIPNYEIIIVGNSKINPSDKIKIIEFDENIKQGWITRKKNIIVQTAIYDNIVLLHDYIVLNEDWYEGFLKFGDDFDWCVTRIINNNGNRFRDYVLFPGEYFGTKNLGKDIDDYFNYHCFLPYDFINNIKTNKYLYISGSYYVIKKHIALEHPLDENFVHCGGEDLEYSVRLHSKGIYIQCNHHSSVHFLKQKIQMNWEQEINSEYLNKYVEYCNNN